MAGDRWMVDRWPRFGLLFGLALIGWLLLDVVPWWTAPLVVIADAGWSARRGDWSLVAFVAWSAIAVAVTAAVVPLLL